MSRAFRDVGILTFADTLDTLVFRRTAIAFATIHIGTPCDLVMVAGCPMSRAFRDVGILTYRNDVCPRL
jgi:hypothetical protein